MANDPVNIWSCLPHRPPFVLISRLIRASADQFETEFFIAPEHILVDEERLTEIALIENIAQTCACGLGRLDQLSGKEPGIGYIGSISRVIVYQLPPVNSRIFTKAEVTRQLGNVYVIKGCNFLDGQPLLECELKIVVQ